MLCSVYTISRRIYLRQMHENGRRMSEIRHFLLFTRLSDSDDMQLNQKSPNTGAAHVSCFMNSQWAQHSPAVMKLLF